MFKPRSYFASLLAFLLLCCTFVNAQAFDNPATDAIKDVADAITAHTIVVGVLAIIGGLILIFFGHRLFYPTLFLGGFYVFASLAYVILVNVEPDSGYNNRDTLILVACLAAGVVGGLMATCLVKFGIACIGAAGGFTLALFIMSWQDGGVISSGIGKILFFIAMIVVGIIVIFVILKPALIIATSVLGAYSFVFGVDIFSRLGFAQTVRSILVTRKIDVDGIVNSKVIALLITMVVLAIVGMVVQFRTNRNRQFIPAKRV